MANKLKSEFTWADMKTDANGLVPCIAQDVENNEVLMAGEIVSDFRFSHEVLGEKFYLFDLKVKRLSSAFDVLPIMVSERILDVTKNPIGADVEVEGQIRSYNNWVDGKSHLLLSVFAESITNLEEPSNLNHVTLQGFICKNPIYRKTPLGREIADLLLAVNRPYGKSDYIPCICWGRNARFASGFEVGEHVQVLGRIQSREYVKKLSETESEKRIAYEVSVSKLECATD